MTGNVVSRNIMARFRDRCCSGITTLHYVLLNCMSLSTT